MTRYAAVTGRFQPFHLGHLELVRIAAAQCDELIIGITNPDPGSWREHPDSAHRHRAESNPFTFWQRHRMIDATLRDARGDGTLPDRPWTIVPFPLDRPEAWFDYIPPEAIQYVRAFTDWERAKASALSDGGYAVHLIEAAADSAVRASEIRSAWAAGDIADHLMPASVSRATASLGVAGGPGISGMSGGGRP